jgi:glucokinase
VYHNGGDLILPDIADAIRERLEKHGVSMDDVEGIGVGVPGPVLDDGVVNGCVNLGWGVFNVAEKLSALLGGIRVVAGNDANVAALGEQWRGGGKGFKNVVMVTLGTGVGGGIIIGGRILPGGHGAAGEIGHMQMRKNETAVCGCGKKGCLEQYASATGIVRLAKLALADTTKPSSLRSLAEVTSKDIFDAAKTGDAMALKLVDTLGEMLGSALAHITAVVDPDVIVIGGGVSKAGQILLDAIVKHYRPAAFHACRDTEFKLAVLGNDAGMYGAVRMVLNG